MESRREPITNPNPATVPNTESRRLVFLLGRFTPDFVCPEQGALPDHLLLLRSVCSGELLVLWSGGTRVPYSSLSNLDVYDSSIR